MTDSFGVAFFEVTKFIADWPEIAIDVCEFDETIFHSESEEESLINGLGSEIRDGHFTSGIDHIIHRREICPVWGCSWAHWISWSPGALIPILESWAPELVLASDMLKGCDIVWTEIECEILGVEVDESLHVLLPPCLKHLLNRSDISRSHF